MKELLLVLAFYFFVSVGFAQQTYAGKIAGQAATLTFTNNNENNEAVYFSGSYFYNSQAKPIDITGKYFIKSGKIGITEQVNGKVTGYFNGTISQDRSSSFAGIWTSTDGKKNFKYSFKLVK